MGPQLNPDSRLQVSEPPRAPRPPAPPPCLLCGLCAQLSEPQAARGATPRRWLCGGRNHRSVLQNRCWAPPGCLTQRLGCAPTPAGLTEVGDGPFPVQGPPGRQKAAPDGDRTWSNGHGRDPGGTGTPKHRTEGRWTLSCQVRPGR